MWNVLEKTERTGKIKLDLQMTNLWIYCNCAGATGFVYHIRIVTLFK